jgi:hypothetical protein
MKRIVIILILIFVSRTMLAQVRERVILPTINSMKAYTGGAPFVFVLDSATGGDFYLYTGSTTSDEINIYAGQSSRKWRRAITIGPIIDTVRAVLPVHIRTGPLGDSITVKNDSAAWNAKQLFGRNIQDISPTNGQILTWDNTNNRWYPTTPSGTGDFSSNTSSSVDNELVLFSGTGGKTGKRATGSGFAFLTSGVLSAISSTGSGNVVLATSPTITTPTIASFTNATHNHTNAAGGGQLTDAALSAVVTVPKGGTGLGSLSTYAILAGGTTTNGNIQQISGLGTAGQVLTSNGAGALPTWQTVSGGGGGITTVGSFSGSSQTDGATISGATITFGPADVTNPGMVSTGTQTWTGNKQFNMNVGIGGAPSWRLNVVDATTGITGDNIVISATNSGATFNTTAAARNSYAGYFVNNATRATGSNILTNYAIYATASSGQENWAAFFDGKIRIGSSGGTPNANDLLFVYRSIPGNYGVFGGFDQGQADSYAMFGMRNSGAGGQSWNFGTAGNGETFFGVPNKFFIFHETSATMRFVLETDGRTGIGGITSPTAYVHVPAATSTISSIRMNSSSGTNPSSPNSGDLWWNGTALNFRTGSTTINLLASAGADVSSNTSTSVDGEIALFSGTTGKILKRATGTGIATLTSGVLSVTSTTGTGTVVLSSSPTIVTPTIASFTNAQHDHGSAAGGGTINHSSLSGLTIGDPHTQYVVISGRSGGQVITGSTSTNSGLILKATSGVGTTGANIVFQGGNNGATTFATFNNSGSLTLNVKSFYNSSLGTLVTTGADDLVIPTWKAVYDLVATGFTNANVTTTNNTPTTVVTIPASAGQALTVEVSCAAVLNDGLASYHAVKSRTFLKSASGGIATNAITTVIADTYNLSTSTLSTCTFTITNDGTNIFVQFTGETSKTILAHFKIKVTYADALL